MLRDKRRDGTVALTGGNPALQAWPVGSIYMSVAATDPGAIFGGTWARWGKGRVPVSLDEADATWDTPEETGGAKTATLTTANLPDHQHSLNVRNSSGFGTAAPASGSVAGTASTVNTNGMTSGGSATPVSIVQPFIAVYMWKRTA